MTKNSLQSLQGQVHVKATFDECVQIAKTISSEEMVAIKMGALLYAKEIEILQKENEKLLLKIQLQGQLNQVQIELQDMNATANRLTLAN